MPPSTPCRHCGRPARLELCHPSTTAVIALFTLVFFAPSMIIQPTLAFIPPTPNVPDPPPAPLKDGSYGYTAVLVVPTGVGAAIGGYAGDALPLTRAMAGSGLVDTLVTHPNVMNGASLYWPDPRVLYTEGYALDQFARGRVGLLPFDRAGRGGHRIGLILDAAMEEDMRLRHIQVADAARATLGINVAEYLVTDEPLGVGIAMSPGGASWGTIARPDSLLRAAHRLVKRGGCTALAIVGRFPDDEDEEMLQAYRQGAGVDAVGGAEAIISHLVTSELHVPCAHAPGLPPLDVDASVSPRACAEELGYTFLACVLANLHKAPYLVADPQGRSSPVGSRALWAESVDAILAPASACGGPAVLSLLSPRSQGKAILLAVEDNLTAMKSYPDGLGLDASRCHRVKTYAEALGVMAAHKAGVNLASLTPHLPSIPLHGTGDNLNAAFSSPQPPFPRVAIPQNVGI